MCKSEKKRKRPHTYKQESAGAAQTTTQHGGDGRNTKRRKHKKKKLALPFQHWNVYEHVCVTTIHQHTTKEKETKVQKKGGKKSRRLLNHHHCTVSNAMEKKTSRKARPATATGRLHATYTLFSFACSPSSTPFCCCMLVASLVAFCRSFKKESPRFFCSFASSVFVSVL